LADLWDFASSSDPNLVEVHISALRRKVDGPFGTRMIVTVRGVGYRLGAVGG
jgi:DNA-binding response OmpR family regulator